MPMIADHVTAGDGPVADVYGLSDVVAMRIITHGKIYGIAGALTLLTCFVVPPQIELSGTACSIWSFASTGCEAGVRAVLRGAVIYSLFSGYIISRTLDREPVVTPPTAMLVFVGSIVLLGLPLWLALHAAFW